MYIDTCQTEKFMTKPTKNNLPELTPREIEILRLIGLGLSSKLIACQLYISLHTVAGHRANLLQKSGARNTVELVSLYKEFL